MRGFYQFVPPNLKPKFKVGDKVMVIPGQPAGDWIYDWVNENNLFVIGVDWAGDKMEFAYTLVSVGEENRYSNGDVTDGFSEDNLRLATHGEDL